VILGYVRVSTKDQNPQLQRDALADLKPDRVYEDHVTGTKADRPAWRQLMLQVRPGDTIVAWSWDRVGRNASHLCQLIEMFQQEGIGFRSVMEDFDLDTPSGRLFAQIVGAFAEFEASMNRERRQAGQKAREKSGLPPPGRPSTLKPMLTAIMVMVGQGMHPKEIAASLSISERSVYRGIEMLRVAGAIKEMTA
jgi:DNA invertase Pin-like site-specific DNA recombinase